MTPRESALIQLWNTWSPETLSDFCITLDIWYRGEGYMYTGSREGLLRVTPFDFFEEQHPYEFAQYSQLINSSVARRDLPFYRTILFGQAENIVYNLDRSNVDVDLLMMQLLDQNTLSFSRTALIHAEDFVDYDVNIKVRRFSSWTLSPSVAYRLSLEGGMYQIGQGSVLVRVPPHDVIVVHTLFAGKAFERYMRKRLDFKDKCHLSLFLWEWQKEYVILAPDYIVACDGIAVMSMEGYEFYEHIQSLDDAAET